MEIFNQKYTTTEAPTFCGRGRLQRCAGLGHRVARLASHRGLHSARGVQNLSLAWRILQNAGVQVYLARHGRGTADHRNELAISPSWAHL